ncbi:MAG: CapA family protein, partial [Bellilinea sp.]|nr:CapA family protein [Bellilinea sp.]
MNTVSPLQERVASLTPPVIPLINSPVYLSSDPLPAAALSQIRIKDNVEWVTSEEAADYSLKIIQKTNDRDQQTVVQWVYAIASAFPTIQDEISLRQVIDCWRGVDCGGFRLLVSEETQSIFTELWGIADPTSVVVVPAEQMLEKAWQERDLRAILPFDQLEPRWKVLRVDNISPLDQNFSIKDYALTVQWGWQTNSNEPFVGFSKLQEVVANRLPDKFTSLILTGTTALVRQTAERIELNGLDYPLEDIGDWLRGADITHVSNEVSFYENCPPAVPVRGGQRFCANPRYIELLTMAGVDVVELTGNHLLDWGSEPFLFTLDLYDQNGFLFYGGGRNLEEARRPLLITHNGNRLAIIGCNRAGPENIW